MLEATWLTLFCCPSALNRPNSFWVLCFWEVHTRPVVSMNIRIVTDSTCDLPPALVAQYGIKVVPAYVNIGQESYLDGVTINRTDFYDNLPSYRHHPTSAAPAPGTFAEVYQQLKEEGATHILTIHVSSTLSSILNSAVNGAGLVSGVEVIGVDSRQLSMGLGFQVLEAARLALAGRPAVEIVGTLKEMVPRIHIFCLLDTLDALRRGGRVNWIQVGFSTLLNIKPIVHVFDGEVKPATRVRTRKKAIQEMADLTMKLGQLSQVAFLDSNAPEDLDKVEELIRPGLAPEVETLRSIACPAIGVHVGAKALGIACLVKG